LDTWPLNHESLGIHTPVSQSAEDATPSPLTLPPMVPIPEHEDPLARAPITSAPQLSETSEPSTEVISSNIPSLSSANNLRPAGGVSQSSHDDLFTRTFIAQNIGGAKESTLVRCAVLPTIEPSV
jgi:hypothetical protein